MLKNALENLPLLPNNLISNAANLYIPQCNYLNKYIIAIVIQNGKIKKKHVQCFLIRISVCHLNKEYEFLYIERISMNVRCL